MGCFSWENNRRWLELLSYSGSPLFLSIKPSVLTPEQAEDIKKALLRWNSTVLAGECAIFRPIDWMESNTPRLYEVSEPGKEGTTVLRMDWADVDHISQYRL
jgi:alpha-galactosidase